MRRRSEHLRKPVLAHARTDFTTLRGDWPARQALEAWRRGLTGTRSWCFFAVMMTRLTFLLALGVTLVQTGAAELVWQTDLAKAQATAKTEKKLVLIDFTGSNWCPPCKMLDRDVFRTPEFATYAQKNLVLVKADFPKPNNLPKAQREANEKLSTRFSVEGLPTVVLLDGAGQEVGRSVGYDGGGLKPFMSRLGKRFKD